MEDARLVYVEKYLGELATFLGLHFWRFRAETEQAPDDCWADININEFNEGRVRLGKEFWRGSDAEKTQALLHELLHAPPARIWDSVHAAIESLLCAVPRANRALVEAQLKIHRKQASLLEEQWVEQQALLLSQFAPKWKPV